MKNNLRTRFRSDNLDVFHWSSGTLGFDVERLEDSFLSCEPSTERGTGIWLGVAVLDLVGCKAVRRREEKGREKKEVRMSRGIEKRMLEIILTFSQQRLGSLMGTQRWTRRRYQLLE